MAWLKVSLEPWGLAPGLPLGAAFFLARFLAMLENPPRGQYHHMLRGRQAVKKALAHLKQADPVLARVIARVGPMKMPRTPPTFHFVVRAIAFQQLHRNAAKTIFA